MFYKKCGTQVKEGGRFCPKCGTTIQVPQRHLNDSGVIIKHSKPNRVKKILCSVGTTAVVVIVCIITVTNVIKSKPIPSLALGIQGVTEQVRNMESGHIAGSGFDIDFEIDLKNQEIYMYGIIEEGYSDSEIACCIEENDGAVAYRDGHDIEVKYMSSSDIKQFWNAFDSADDIEDFDLEGYLDSNFAYYCDLDEYLNIDKVNDAYKDVVQSLSKRSTQKKIEDALEIEKQGIFGKKTYTVNLDGSGLVDACAVIFDVLEEEASDVIRGGWLHEAESESRELSSLGSLGTLEWIVKGKKLTSLSYNGNIDGESIDILIDFSYGISKLKEIDFYAIVDNDEVNFKVDEIGKVKDVKYSIPSNILKEMGMK